MNRTINTPENIYVNTQVSPQSTVKNQPTNNSLNIIQRIKISK